MTAWKQLAKAHEMHMPEFSFANGERRHVKVHCRTLGQLNSARNNAVLLLHGTTGSSMQFLQPDMANFLFERDQPLDHNEYFLITRRRLFRHHRSTSHHFYRIVSAVDGARG